MNGKKSKTRVRVLEIWLLMAVPWVNWSCALRCLQGYTRFARGCKSGCLCTVGQAVPTCTERCMFPGTNKPKIFLFVSGADKEKGGGKQMASKKSAISKLS